MENSLYPQLLSKLYAADSLSGFIASLPLAYPAGLFSSALEPLFLPEPLKEFSLKAHTPCSAGTAAETPLSPLPGGRCALDLCRSGSYAGSLVLDAPPETVQSDSAALAHALSLALDLFIPEGVSFGQDMDSFLEDMAEPPGELICLYCAVNAASRAAGKLCAELSARLPMLHHCRTGGGTAMLFGCGRAELDALSSFFNSTGYPYGISGPFAKPILAHGCAQKAMRACALSAPCEMPVSFSGARWQAFCEESAPILRRLGYSPADFLHGGLSGLLAFDTENSTDYFDSLYAYLSHGKSLRRAAETLGLHRNTLDYRLRRIRELFGLDLDDQNVCFELLFSCKLFLTQGKPAPGGSCFSEALFSCLRDPALPPALREKAAEALCRQETALLRDALRGEESGGFTLPQEVDPLLFFTTDDQELSEEQRSALHSEFRELFPRAALAFDETMTALCFHCPLPEREKFLSDCSALMRKYRCQGVVSSPVQSGSFFRRLRLNRMALAVSRRLNAQEPLVRFEEHASMVMFLLLQEEHMPLYLYHAEEALMVIQQDYENGTELSRSLYGYLSCFLDLKQASVQTGIHRNTIANHVRRIMGLIRADRMDGDLGFDILCTYRMLSMMDS